MGDANSDVARRRLLARFAGGPISTNFSCYTYGQTGWTHKAYRPQVMNHVALQP